MRDIPDAADLLATARDTLMNELLPLLPREQRYTGLMIANCLAISAREQEAGSDAEDEELSGLRVLLSESAVARARADDAAGVHDGTSGHETTTVHDRNGGHRSDTRAELRSVRRVLRDAIRAGSFDTGLHHSALL